MLQWGPKEKALRIDQKLVSTILSTIYLERACNGSIMIYFIFMKITDEIILYDQRRLNPQ